MKRLLGERAWLLARIGDEAGLQARARAAAPELACEPEDTSRALDAAACADAAFDAG